MANKRECALEIRQHLDGRSTGSIEQAAIYYHVCMTTCIIFSEK